MKAREVSSGRPAAPSREGPRRIVFIDRLTLAELARIVVLGRGVQAVWYFDPISPWLARALAALARAGLCRARWHHIPYHVGQARNEAGECTYAGNLDEARSLCAAFRDEVVAADPLINSMGKLWPLGKLLFHFDKLTERDVRTECLRIGLVQWMIAALRLDAGGCVLRLPPRPWWGYLEAFSRAHGVRIAKCRRFEAFGALAVMAGRVAAIGGHALRWRAASARGRRGPGSPIQRRGTPRREASGPTVAIRYWHRGLGFDPCDRSEFFWVQASGVPLASVILYDYQSEKPVSRETLDALQARGVTLLGNAPGVRPWRPTLACVRIVLQTMLRVLRAAVGCVRRGRRVSAYVFWHLIGLAIEYAYWRDFFAAYRVRVHVGTMNTSIAQVLALNALGGVSVGYQYSISNMLVPTTFLSGGENVQCVFSALYERVWRSVGAPVDQYLATGFIHDDAVEALRRRGRAAEVRARLQQHGARFIIGFFDENSVNRWDIDNSDADAADDYAYLLQWLLRDPGLGLVFKPKKPTTLFRRIASIAGLVERSRATGRCAFLLSDTLAGSVFPAEAALIADFCIGKIVGSTAALEARLAGRPSVLLDTEGHTRHPFYAWGMGRVVFRDWAALRRAIEAYRAQEGGSARLGEWEPEIKELDPYGDGQGAARIGLTIRWIFDALNTGASPREAVAQAAARFAARWRVGPVPPAGGRPASEREQIGSAA